MDIYICLYIQNSYIFAIRLLTKLNKKYDRKYKILQNNNGVP